MFYIFKFYEIFVEDFSLLVFKCFFHFDFLNSSLIYSTSLWFHFPTYSSPFPIALNFNLILPKCFFVDFYENLLSFLHSKIFIQFQKIMIIFSSPMHHRYLCHPFLLFKDFFSPIQFTQRLFFWPHEVKLLLIISLPLALFDMFSICSFEWRPDYSKHIR